MLWMSGVALYMIPNNLHVAVISVGGIISEVHPAESAVEALKWLEEHLPNGLNHDEDDARIFDADGDEVYSFPSKGEVEQEMFEEQLTELSTTIGLQAYQQHFLTRIRDLGV